MKLAAHDLSVSLSGRTVLTDASLDMDAGAVVGLIGPNGASKSTLLRALCRQVAASGTVTLDGRDISALRADDQARKIAYLPQSRVIGWPMAVRDVVALGRMPWRGFGEDDAAICADAMAMMDVSDLAGRPATALSGGEQARVLTARAVAQATPILLADEPGSGLDPAHQMIMMRAFRELAAKDRAVLVCLHDLTLAARWCDRVIVMDGGRIVAGGVPEDVMTAELLRNVFGIEIHASKDSCGMLLTPTGLVERAR